MHKAKVLFMHCGGQDDNIGDVVLRRAMYRRFSDFDEKYVLLINQSQSFEDGLELDDDVHVVRDVAEFRSMLLERSRREEVAYVENAGELRARLRSVAKQIEAVRLVRSVRRNGGVALKLGVGYRYAPGIYRFPLKWALNHYSLVGWRDDITRKWTGVGVTMPDWGFIDRGPKRWTEMSRSRLDIPSDRRRVVVSLRGDRPFPSQDWISGVRQFCNSAGLSPVVVTQVRRDAAAGSNLAKALGAEELTWRDDVSHTDQEIMLRDIYRQAILVVSNRLHVLVLAFNEGAVPLNLSEYPDRKTARHFDVIGYMHSAVDSTGKTAAEIEILLHAALNRIVEMPERRQNALEQWEQFEAELAKHLNPSASYKTRMPQ